MTGPAWLTLVVVIGLAVVDWWAVAVERRDVERWAKPATSGAIVVLALAAGSDAGAARWWFALGVVGCVAGDVLLFQDRFRDGLVAFLAGHVAFVVGLATRDPDLLGAVIGLGVAGVVMIELGRPVLEGVRRRSRALLVPVAVYVGAMGALVAMSFASTVVAHALGASTFAVSDALIGRRRFVDERPWYRITSTVTYHVGLTLLVLGLAVAVG